MNQQPDTQPYPTTVPCPEPTCKSHGAWLRTRGGVPSDYECPVCKTVVPLPQNAPSQSEVDRG